ncbi:hypothetical protein RKE25_02605 [Dyella sp. BiH032]|uniref:hypothetical protein n=1 Tax=Dyella sp. BiH032 TaxID=3075430 RepID=UPI002892E275|nr:hypothetical protein [Dyella sp. BiH032]WNL46547.1 hypothetical protein RKE25_02605 [Dyella sp. BiH032]
MTESANARIRALAAGITAEMIAEQTHLFYNPQSGAAWISFQARESIFVNGTFQATAGDYDVLQVTVDEIATRCLGIGNDPVTGVDLSKVSAAGMAMIIKAAYDTLFNERAAAKAASAEVAG